MKNRITLICLLLVLVVAASGAAFGKDAIQASVTPITPPTPITTLNGNGLVPGNYAIGTIQLTYTYVGYVFPVGNFAQFTLGLQDLTTDSNKPFPQYPTLLSLNQTGSSNLVLSPAQTGFSVTGPGWQDQTVVTISIPSSVQGDSNLNADGTTLVGNLQMEAGDSHLGTTTTIQVKIKLVHPTACLKVYDFISDQGFTTTLDTVQLQVRKKDDAVLGIQQYPQLSDNVLVVNTCDTNQSFDLNMTLDTDFRTNPANNPGNAVFTFLKSGELDATGALAFAQANAGTGQGQNLCLKNINLPAGETLLTTVHMTLVDGLYLSTVNASPFKFLVELDTAGSACATGSYDTLATPNPLFAPLAWTH